MMEVLGKKKIWLVNMELGVLGSMGFVKLVELRTSSFS